MKIILTHEVTGLGTAGDVVDVVTSPTSRPNPNWVTFVRTGRARSEIRHYLKTMKYEESVDLGRRLLEQSIRQLDRAPGGALGERQRAADVVPVLVRHEHRVEVAGIEAGLHTILVMTGISDRTEIERYPFRPDEVIDSVADLLDPLPHLSSGPED